MGMTWIPQGLQLNLATTTPCTSLAVIFVILSVMAIPAAALVGPDPRTTLQCHVRTFEFRVTKPTIVDSVTGRVLRCSGSVTVNSCWGRCDSSEIGDYQMPFRISRHPVCTYTGRIARTATLSNCDGYPDPTVEVFDAAGCACRLCDSDYTSCEDLN